MATVVAGSSVPGLAMDIARELSADFIGVATSRFPDGELHIQIEEPSVARRVYYVQTMAPLPNERLTELLLTCDLLSELGCREIVAVVPYLGYTRQDHRKAPGEAVSVGTLFRLLEGVGVKEIVSVDIHLHRLSVDALKEMTDIEIKEVSAMPLLAKKCSIEEPLVVAPDMEAMRWARSAAEALKMEYAAMEKSRITPTKVEVSFGKLNVSDRNIMIVDDIVSTGGTMIETAKLLKSKGAGKVYAAFTHAVFSSVDCIANMFNAGITSLISTNTIQNEFSTVNVTELIASALS
ncbi:MAG: ribose-phosphate diphosphokinase [Candidatus Hydrothermarchaeales archaeon]